MDTEGQIVAMTRLIALLMLIAGPALADDTIIDLTHAYDADIVYWPTASDFELEIDFKGMTEGGWCYEANTFRSAEHGGNRAVAYVSCGSFA